MAKILVKKLPQKKTFNKIVIGAITLFFTLGFYWWWKSKTHTNQQPFLALTYENKNYGIEIQYPDNWRLEAVADPFGTIAKFLPTNSQSSSSFSRVSIIVDDISYNTSLADYTNSAVSQILEFSPDAEIIDNSLLDLGDISGNKIIYTTKDAESNLPLKYLQFWTLQDGHAYIITYVAEKDKYQDSLEIVQETMLKSFTINN